MCAGGPAVSTTTTSCPRARAASTASNATAAGSAPRGEPTKSAPARSAQISSCSSAAARNVSAAPTSTERPCSRSFWASLPIVVVLPVPLTPTTRITLGEPSSASVGGPPKSASTSSASASSKAPSSPRASRRRTSSAVAGHADVAADQRLLEPLPGLVVARIERRGRDLLRERAAALRERLAHAAEEARALGLVGSRRSPRPRGSSARTCQADTRASLRGADRVGYSLTACSAASVLGRRAGAGGRRPARRRRAPSSRRRARPPPPSSASGA